MSNEAERSNKIGSNFIYRIVKIDPALKVYNPIIGTGLRILLSSWSFPTMQRERARNVRLRLAPDEQEAVRYLMEHTSKSAAEIISAALLAARHSHVRPPARRNAACASAEAAD